MLTPDRPDTDDVLVDRPPELEESRAASAIGNWDVATQDREAKRVILGEQGLMLELGGPRLT